MPQDGIGWKCGCETAWRTLNSKEKSNGHDTGTEKDNRQDFMKRHPRARKILLEGIKRAAIGRDRFWKELSHSARQKFIRDRADRQTLLYPAGSPARRKQGAKMKVYWASRRAG